MTLVGVLGDFLFDVFFFLFFRLIIFMRTHAQIYCNCFIIFFGFFFSYLDKTERPVELVQTVRGRQQPDGRQRRRFAEDRHRERRWFRLGRGPDDSGGRGQTVGVPVPVHVRPTGFPAENHGLQIARVHQVRNGLKLYQNSGYARTVDEISDATNRGISGAGDVAFLVVFLIVGREKKTSVKKILVVSVVFDFDS